MQLNSLAGQVLPLLGPAQASAELRRRCQRALLAVQNLPAQNIRLLRFQTDCMVSCLVSTKGGHKPCVDVLWSCVITVFYCSEVC